MLSRLETMCAEPAGRAGEEEKKPRFREDENLVEKAAHPAGKKSEVRFFKQVGNRSAGADAQNFVLSGAGADRLFLPAANARIDAVVRQQRNIL